MLCRGLKYEDSAFGTGNHAVERQPVIPQPSYRLVTSSGGKGGARPDHPRTRARSGYQLFDHYQVDKEQPGAPTSIGALYTTVQIQRT